MKRVVIVFTVILILILLASCYISESAVPKNAIIPSVLTEDQQEILDLFSVSNSQELMLFDFNTDKTYENIEVWVEVYKYGILVERPASISSHSKTDEM